jgi:hypothetical protein
MSSFTDPLIVTPMKDGRNWKLVKPFSYHVGSKFSRTVITVPKGFVTDFASVPRFLWGWIPYWGKWGKASVIHDYLYSTHQVERSITDAIFYEAMLVEGTNPRITQLMYYAVRLFGWMAWHPKGKKYDRR